MNETRIKSFSLMLDDGRLSEIGVTHRFAAFPFASKLLRREYSLVAKCITSVVTDSGELWQPLSEEGPLSKIFLNARKSLRLILANGHALLTRAKFL